MICSNCGAENAAEDAFCGECGAPLIGQPSPEPIANSQPALPLAGPQPAPPAAISRAAPAVDRPSIPAPPQPVPRRSRTNPLLTVLIGILVIGGALLRAGLLPKIFNSSPTPTPDWSVIGAPTTDWNLIQAPTEVLIPTEVPIATSDPVETPPAQITVGALLFEDDFSDELEGWDVFDEDGTQAAYAGQQYQVAVRQANYAAWGNPTVAIDFDDFVMETDVTQLEGPVDNNVGLLVRYQPDDENFYWFQISADGYYSVDMLRNGEWDMLVDWTETEVVFQGTGVTNHLMVVCDGSQFSFYANGAHLVDVVDDTFTSGNIGLGAGVFGEAGAVWQFDNVKVYALAK